MLLFRVGVFGSACKCYGAIVARSILSSGKYSFGLAVPFGLSIKNRRFSVSCQTAQTLTPEMIGSRLLYYDTVRKSRLGERGVIVGLILSSIGLIRVLLRLLRLIIMYAPLMIFYPICRGHEHRFQRWCEWAMYLVENSGPAIIKFAQWASTRRDLFSRQFCDLFSRLHTSASPHEWKRTEDALREVLGSNWRDYFLELDEACCGSGCVAQVHKARLNYVAVHRAPQEIRQKFENYERPCVDVAVKVVHPGVREAIAIDMSILSGMATILHWIVPCCRYVDPKKCVQEFQAALYRQIDLRYEGDALRVFSQQFHDNGCVHFPKPLLQTEGVLIETFEEGKHISHYLTSSDVEMKRKLARMGMDALLKMIFVNNFVHGDLHPGNIIVQDYDHVQSKGVLSKMGEGVRRLVRIKRDGDDVAYNGSVVKERRMRLVFLDAGISFQLSQRDLNNLRAVFRAVIDADGAKAGELLLQNAPQERCSDSAAFKKEVALLVSRARSATVSLGTVDVSNLLSDLLSTVSRHGVSLEPNFTCVVLAVLVLEGLGRSLYPQLDLLEEARSVLLRVALG